MAYIFPERSEESEHQQPLQGSLSSAEQEIPVEDSPAQEDSTPIIIERVPSSPEASLPPEAQGETNGGPLGCCLGSILGLFLTFALVTVLSILMVSGGTFITIPVTFVGACAGGYLGWRIGKRVYKEYEQPVVKQRPTLYSAYPVKSPRTKAKRKVQMPK